MNQENSIFLFLCINFNEVDKMKNAIQYYYQLYPTEIHQSNGSYQFQMKDEHYYLTPYNRSFEELQELHKISIQLLERNVYCHQFVLNIKQELITIINHTPYVMFRVFMNSDNHVTIEDILFFSNLITKDTEKSLLRRNQWKELWMEKNDYFEYQVSQFGKGYPKIRESFSYFIGLSEIGISLLNEVKKEDSLVISHRRICSNDTLFDLYNPLNFVLDYKERDIIEFWKVELLKEDFSVSSFQQFLNLISLQEDQWLLLLARAFYPTFYFDRYEKIIDYHYNENILDEVLKQTELYEQFLGILYLKVRSYKILPDMLWLTKNIG